MVARSSKVVLQSVKKHTKEGEQMQHTVDPLMTSNCLAWIEPGSVDEKPKHVVANMEGFCPSLSALTAAKFQKRGKSCVLALQILVELQNIKSFFFLTISSPFLPSGSAVRYGQNFIS